MKILTLKIKNIASIENAFVDFDAAPLKGESMFLITGDTGSGKTTLLNAICLALYDDAPMLNQINNDIDQDKIPNNNSRQLMRKGAVECFVTLTFIGNDNKHYEANWELHRAHRKPNGEMQNAVWTLNCIDDGITYTKKGDVKRQIAEAVGLSFEQFTRTTMLAQGEFAAFMKAKDDQKSAILEKLTGTEVYATIGAKIFELYTQAKHAYELLEHEIEKANLLDSKQKQDYQEQIVALGAEIVRLLEEIKTFDVKIGHIKSYLELKQKLESYIARKVAIEAWLNAPEITERRAKIELWDATDDVRRLIAQRGKLDAQIRDIELRLKEIVDTKLPRLMLGVQYIRVQKEEGEQQLSLKKQQLHALTPLDELLAQEGRIRLMSNDLSKAMVAIGKYTNDLEANQKKINKVQADIAELNDRIEIIRKEVNELAGDISATELELQQFDLAALRKAESDLNDRKSLLEKLIGIYKSLSECDNNINTVSSALATGKKELAEHEEEHRLLQARLEQQLNEANELKAKYEGSKELSDHIASIRKRFAHTDVCPLCGSEGVELHHDDVIAGEVAKAKYKADEAQKLYDETLKRVQELSSQIQAKKTIIANNEQTLAGYCQQRAGYLAEIEGLMPDDIVLNEGMEMVQLSYLIDNVCETKSRVSADCNRAVTVQNRLNTLRKRHQEQVQELDKQQKKLDKSKTEQVTYSTEAASIKSHIDENAKRCDELMVDLRGLIPNVGNPVAAVLIDWCARNGCEISDDLQTLDIAAINRISGILSKIQEEKSQIAEQLTKLETVISELAGNYAQERETLSRYIDFDENASPIEIKNLHAEIQATIASYNTLIGSNDSVHRQVEALKADIQAFYANTEISPESVELIMTTSEGDIVGWRHEINQQQENLRDNLSHIESSKNEMSEKFASLQEQEAESDLSMTYEETTAAKAEIEAKRDRLIGEKSRIETLIAEDDKKAESVAERRLELERQRLEVDEWDTLNKLFGGATGHCFKRIAQSYILQALLRKANYYLCRFSSRYKLFCNEGSLSIYVSDLYQGETVRNVGLLSGGESFVVSLSLALGLSAISKDKIDVDTLFIDEGFGTLDRETLETVITTLEQLHQIGGRRIGLISHVEEIRRRIATQIVVSRVGAASSKVEVKAL